MQKNLKRQASSSARCVICAAGPFSDVSSLRGTLRSDDFVIAADGGLRLAEALGVQPAHLIADFDSLPMDQTKDIRMPVTALPVKKDDTDTMAAAKLGLKLGYREFLLLGATGGRLDHTIANLAVLSFLVENGVRASLQDECCLLRIVLPGEYRIEPVAGRCLSLLPYGGSVSGLTVRHVEYELENAELTCDYPLGISNEFAGQTVELSFTQGILMIFLSKDRASV